VSGEPLAGREATAPSIIRKVKVIQSWEEMPLNGGIVLSQNVHVKPLSSEIGLNASLNIRVLGGPVRSNGLPRGHTDLNGSHPGLSDNFHGGILFTEVFPTSLEPKVVKDETTKNI